MLLHRGHGARERGWDCGQRTGGARSVFIDSRECACPTRWTIHTRGTYMYRTPSYGRGTTYTTTPKFGVPRSEISLFTCGAGATAARTRADPPVTGASGVIPPSNPGCHVAMTASARWSRCRQPAGGARGRHFPARGRQNQDSDVAGAGGSRRRHNPRMSAEERPIWRFTPAQRAEDAVHRVSDPRGVETSLYGTLRACIARILDAKLSLSISRTSFIYPLPGGSHTPFVRVHLYTRPRARRTDTTTPRPSVTRFSTPCTYSSTPRRSRQRGLGPSTSSCSCGAVRAVSPSARLVPHHQRGHTGLQRGDILSNTLSWHHVST